MPDLSAVEARLRAILAPSRDGLAAREDATGLVLEMPGHEGKPWGYVAGTRLGGPLAGSRPMGDTTRHTAAGGPRTPAPTCPREEVHSWPR